MTSFDKNTHLLLTHGSVRVSPEQALQLNQKADTLFIDKSTENTASSSGYRVILTGYCDFVYKEEEATREIVNLEKALGKLRSLPRPINGFQLKKSVSVFSVSDNYYRIDYRIHSGQVVVFNIQPVTDLQKSRDRGEKTAVYKVKKNGSGNWQVAQKVEQVTTDHAAVNGQSNNLAKATWLMGSHLEHEFGKNLTEYTLFHNPSVGGPGDTWESIQDKFGFTTDVTKKFASLLKQTQLNKKSDTSWVVHSQGGAIFAEGVRYILNGDSSWALNKLNLNGARHKDKGYVLDKQKVAFHANANNNMRSKVLFDRAGVEVISVRAHDYDMVTNIIGANTLNPRKLLGSLAYANHVFSGSVSQSPHTTFQSRESWEKNMLDGPGKGRGAIQKSFHKVEKTINNTVNAVKNYLP